MSRLKILIVEDDELFAQTLEDFLEDEGFEVTIASDGESAYTINYEEQFDLLLLDVNLPQQNGFSLLKELRADHHLTPAIYITSYRDKESLQKGFLAGADDYLTKPVDLEELRLRIQALLRRSHKLDHTLTLHGLSYDPQKGTLGGKRLSKKPKLLLDLLLEHPQQCVPKSLIFERVWEWDETPSDASLRVYINTLKNLLGKDAIVNQKGEGYRLEL